MKLKAILSSISVALLLLILNSCGGRDFSKTPLDNYIVEFSNEKSFSIILADMDVDGTFFKTHKHKYKIIKVKDDLPYENTTDWIEVEKGFFWKNEENLGMVVLEKNAEGKISKTASPPGYQYVGNNRYGEWRSNNGNSFWAFYGQYMFMSHMFGMGRRPIYRDHYNSYSSGGYYGSRNYYGPKVGKSNMYGTSSAQTRKSNPTFFQRRATKSGWSSSRSRSGGRSRGSGFGK
ncbi:MAG: hypothetical protein JKY48_07430 [Flavobacteriales bacterium]|nr:hypothetical protein [Flavobacteriales bacterium]